MRTPKVIRPRKTGIMALGILLLVAGILAGALGLMGRSQTDYYARKVKLSEGEWIEYATGKKAVEPLTEEDYKGRNLNASGKAKQALNEQLEKITGLDKVIMPWAIPLLIAGAVMLAAGAWLLISHDVWPMITVLAIIFYLVFLMYPLYMLLRQALLNSEGHLSFEMYEKIFSKAYYSNAIWHSLLISAVVTLASVLIATPMAYIMSTMKIRGAGVLQILILVSSMSAPFIGAYAWIQLCGRNGIITNLLATIGINLGDIYGFKGCVIVMSFQLYSLVFMFTHVI